MTDVGTRPRRPNTQTLCASGVKVYFSQLEVQCQSATEKCYDAIEFERSLWQLKESSCNYYSMQYTMQFSCDSFYRLYFFYVQWQSVGRLSIHCQLYYISINLDSFRIKLLHVSYASIKDLVQLDNCANSLLCHGVRTFSPRTIPLDNSPPGHFPPSLQ